MTPLNLLHTMRVLHNMDRQDLEHAGIIREGPAGNDLWTRFNDNLTTFVLKLSVPNLVALAALIERKLEGNK